MKALGGIALLLAAGCATLLDEQRWIRVETANFVLMSGAQPSETLRVARGLELIRSLLERYGLETDPEPRQPLVVVVFRDEASFARFRPESGVGGFLLSGGPRAFLVVHAGPRADARAEAIRHYAHFVARTAEAGHPGAYDRGLAVFLSVVAIEAGEVVVGGSPPSRAGWLAVGAAWQGAGAADELVDRSGPGTPVTELAPIESRPIQHLPQREKDALLAALALSRDEERSGRATPPPTGAPRPIEAHLDVDAPPSGQRIEALLAWVEVVGRGGLREAARHDVVIAIDASSSTLAPAFASSSDPDDTVLHAEIAAARALIRQLDPRTTRAAVLTFAGRPRGVAPLGPPEAALSALAVHPIEADPSGTSLANALRGALRELFENREVGVRRQRTIVLLSDGQPTAPTLEQATRDALAVAEWLGEIGVPVQAFAWGERAARAPGFYRSLADRSGGAYVLVEEPGDIVSELANVRLTGLRRVEIRSLPGGGSGRAVRVFADGSFDAYVPLVEGENVLEIRAFFDRRPALSTTRTVHYQRPAQPTASDRAEAARLRQALETRALEIDLLAEMRSRTRPETRRLEIDAEPVGSGPGAR